MLNKARVWFGQIAPLRLAGYLAAAVLVFFLYFWNMTGYTRGQSAEELSAKTGSLSHSAIFANPLNLGHKLLQYIFLKISPDSIISLKLASAIAACAFGFCFYKLASGWFGKLIGGFGTLIFMSLPLFVISARQSSAEIMLFSPIALLWLFAWLNSKNTQHRSWAWVLLATISGLLIYTPGILWFMIGSLIICRKKIRATLEGLDQKYFIAGALIFTVFFVGLVFAGIVHHNFIKQILLLPDGLQSATAIIKNTAWAVSAIFIKAPNNQLVLGNLPVINLVALALIIFGVYAMQAAARAKAVWLGLVLLFGVLAAGLAGNIIYLALGIPAMVILICAGLRYLYIEWRAIFPRNPVPKTFALVLIAAVVASQVYYGIRYSLIAWPHSVATKSVYVLK